MYPPLVTFVRALMEYAFPAYVLVLAYAHGFLPKGFSWIRVPVPQEARVTPSVRAASVRWMPVSGPSTSEAWTGIDEKIQRPQSKELANNF